jgi:hypothetical protein
MKKLTSITCLFLLFTTLVIAQSVDERKTRFALLGGVNFQNITGKDFFGDKVSSTGVFGFHAGLNAQILVAPQFYFQPGLLFSTKGAEISDTDVTERIRLSYLELPLNFVYKSQLGSGFIMIGFGPYVGYGISGNANYKSTLGSVDSDVVFTNVVELNDPITSTYFKALDIGGNLFFGYEMASGIFLQLNTQFGMININPEDNRFPGGKATLKNTGFGLSLGYRF